MRLDSDGSGRYTSQILHSVQILLHHKRSGVAPGGSIWKELISNPDKPALDLKTKARDVKASKAMNAPEIPR